MARIRSSSEVDDEESGEDSYAAQSRRNAKRARTDDDVSESSDDHVLPDSYRAQPRHGAASSDVHVPLQHQPGSIVRVKLTNFVTYTSAEFQLGPSLNMIIGPNGTGKSTLVCAICLGLGWGPQHLGRAKELGEFVKHGAREAHIEIELCGGPQSRNINPVIRRVIRREGNKTSFSIGGQPTTHKEVTRLCKSFSIQIDNLCQFLPQDRVVEFAQLGPVQLLEQTQRAAAPEQMNEWHEQLKDMRKEQKGKMDTKSREQDTLRDMQNRHNLQRADVERLQERQALAERLQAYEKIRPFVHYRVAKAKVDECKEQLIAVERVLAELRNDDEGKLEKVEEKREYHRQVESVAKMRSRVLGRTNEHTNKLYERTRVMEAQIEEKENQKTVEKKSNQERNTQYNKLLREIQVIEGRMKERPPEFDPAAFNERSREKQRQARELQAENHNLSQRRQEIVTRIRTMESEKQQALREIDSLKSQAGKQSNKLKTMSIDTWRAWDWIQKNPDQFQNEVFGPPVVSCTVTDNRFVNGVESMFQKGDFLAFTVTNRRDFSLLSKKCQSMGLKDVHIKEASRPRASFRPLMTHEELRQFNLSGWVIDYLNGPEPVLSGLCDNLNLHRCAITLAEHTDAQFERIVTSSIQRWVTRKSSYQVSRRREYGDSATSTTVRDVRPASLWTDQPVDMGAQHERQNRISELEHDQEEWNAEGRNLMEQINTNKDKIQTLNTEKEEIDREKNDLQKIRGEFEGLHTKKQTCETKRDQLKGEVEMAAQRLETIESEADKLILAKGQHAIDYANAVKGLGELQQAVYVADIVVAEAKSEFQQLEERCQEERRRIAECEEEIRRRKSEGKRLKEEAKRLCATVTRVHEQMSLEEEEIVEPIREEISLEDLEAEIETFRARLTMLHGGDPNAIRDYERRAKKIADLEEKLQGLEAELEQLQERIDEIKSQWEPELDALVQKISDAFSFNFSKIGCAGQVSIYKAEDFAEWAIQIQVKFREQEQLSILDSHRQSGGERAVSTIFYLMALQSLARSPFRVVDEINQGMDPRNERMVHERMVDIACQEHTSQYFLITPKLLHGLKFHPRMKVHCIASGEYMPTDYRELDFTALLDVAMRVKGKA